MRSLLVVVLGVAAAVSIGIATMVSTGSDRIERIASGDIQPCRASVLALAYYGNGVGTGFDFGTILIRDTGESPCLLPGPIGVVGTSVSGKPDTVELSYPVPAALKLSAGEPRIPVGGRPSPGEVVAEMILSAEYRDGPFPPTGMCTKHYVIPAVWHLTFLDGSATVRNASRDPGYPSYSSLITCQGRLNAPTGALHSLSFIAALGSR
jgi:hypothetical protein